MEGRNEERRVGSPKVNVWTNEIKNPKGKRKKSNEVRNQMKFERKWERVRGLLTTAESLICGSGSERGNWRTIMKLGGFERERERESDGKAWSFCKKIWKIFTVIIFNQTILYVKIYIAKFKQTGHSLAPVRGSTIESRSTWDENGPIKLLWFYQKLQNKITLIITIYQNIDINQYIWFIINMNILMFVKWE